ncbi:MAG: ABC transporter ATP-binding protein [Spirochaetaceae bacterium]|jgi:iron complex transport system ATP-binding protein|nr:ABC transporter ATP-binding protein [Spirochaetaceae bacterium]
MNILEVKNAAFNYERGKPIFENLSFSLQAGHILSILGPNGCGKSTLLNCLAAISTLSSGEIFLDGKAQRSLTRKEIARLIGYVPQMSTLSYGYTVLDYVVMGRAPYIGALSTPKESDAEIARNALVKMGITHLAGRPYTEISGGERQMATIARVLVQEPRVIMLDEPTAALDFGNQMRALALLKTLSREGYSVIMTTHTPDHAIMLDDTVALLDRNGNFEAGGVEQIMREDALSEVYRTPLKMVYVPEAGRTTCMAVNRG